MELCQDAEFDQLGEEDLDALFEEYGETVRTDAESSNVTSEVDDDSDSLACEFRDLVLTPCCLSFFSSNKRLWSIMHPEGIIIRTYLLKFQLLRVLSYCFNYDQKVHFCSRDS